METTIAPVAVPPTSTTIDDKGPVPMSFPAILRDSGITDRFAHLRIGTGKSVSLASSPYPTTKKSRRDEKEGKRWIRRKENARFVGNPHIVAASKKDFHVDLPSTRATFPEPLPAYLSRNNAIPSAVPTAREPISANAGRFSMSLKGMRRELRRSGPRTEVLVKEVEDEIVSWLRHGGVLLNPDVIHDSNIHGSPVGTLGVISEVSRTPLQLVWSTADDAFARYVVHCCARYHSIVSFSKDTSRQRLTYLLRPNVTRPDFLAPRALDTPPPTDESELSAFEYASESDLVSDRSDAGADSDFEGAPPPSVAAALSAIAESLPASPALDATLIAQDSDEWSVIGDSEGEAGDEAPSDIASSVGSLSLNEHGIPIVESQGIRQLPLRSRFWERQRRSASSPSRSPARRTPPRIHPCIDPPRTVEPSIRRSFHEYLFS
ncbi:unnamed protein product [Somion occarium]|uniref:Uncharacterized protein n=1 Tax=Somion occarium TaxID=3059160 RepID=A0ABP1DHA7_9APHY